MAEFSLKDTLIGGGLLFGIGVFLKSKQGKNKVNLDYDNWGGNPDGKLAKALAKVREESKKPREPLKIEKLDAEYFNAEGEPVISYWQVSKNNPYRMSEADISVDFEGRRFSGKLSEFDEEGNQVFDAEGLTNRQLGQLRRREREREERERESQELQERMDRKRRERNESYLQKLENRGLTLSQKKRDADIVWKHDALLESRSWFVPLRERIDQEDKKRAKKSLMEAYLRMQDSYYYGGFDTKYSYYPNILLDMEILLEEYFNQEE